MSQDMNLQSGYSQPTTTWGYQGTVFTAPVRAGTNRIEHCVVVKTSLRAPRAPSVDIDDLVTMFEQAPNGAVEMAEARRWVSQGIDARKTLRSIRLQAGFSQAALAVAVGLQQPNICAIETGKRRPEYETAQRLARAMNVSVDEIYLAFNQGETK